MTEGHHRRATCRLCGSAALTRVLSLTPTPPANAFVRESDLGVPQVTFPLDVFHCADCAHVQLLDVVDPRALFEDYVYVSGTSPVFVRHFEAYASRCVSRFGLSDGDLAVDIGSNDGTLLRFLQEAGLKVRGIDPAVEIARRASAAGIPTMAAFFTPDVAAEMRTGAGPARLITANNVFAHIDDLDGVARGVAALLAPDGVFAFEVSYLLDVLEKTLFDTIYHEHLDYHAVLPLVGFFRKHGLELFAAERIDTHGGSLRGYVGWADGPRRADGSVEALIATERAAGAHDADRLAAFGRSVDEKGARLRAILAAEKAAGRAIAGFGAPAKATTLMYHFDLGPELIDFVIDDSPLKQGLYTPGLHIPVLPARAIAERRPDRLLILAWNFAEPIMAKHRAFTEAGGRFILPLPEPRLV